LVGRRLNRRPNPSWTMDPQSPGGRVGGDRHDLARITARSGAFPSAGTRRGGGVAEIRTREPGTPVTAFPVQTPKTSSLNGSTRTKGPGACVCLIRQRLSRGRLACRLRTAGKVPDRGEEADQEDMAAGPLHKTHRIARAARA